MPVDGPVSWTAREDAARAAALTLFSDGPHDGPTTLTAGAAHEGLFAGTDPLLGHEPRSVRDVLAAGAEVT